MKKIPALLQVVLTLALVACARDPYNGGDPNPAIRNGQTLGIESGACQAKTFEFDEANPKETIDLAVPADLAKVVDGSNKNWELLDVEANLVKDWGLHFDRSTYVNSSFNLNIDDKLNSTPVSSCGKAGKEKSGLKLVGELALDNAKISEVERPALSIAAADGKIAKRIPLSASVSTEKANNPETITAVDSTLNLENMVQAIKDLDAELKKSDSNDPHAGASMEVFKAAGALVIRTTVSRVVKEDRRITMETSALETLTVTARYNLK